MVEPQKAPPSRLQKGIKDSLASSALKKRKMTVESSDDSDGVSAHEGEERAESMRKPKDTTKKSKPKKSAQDQVRTHTKTTNEPVRVSTRQARVENNLMSDVLNRIYKMQDSIYFVHPVDPVELEIPDYFDIIEKPMDLGTIRDKLRKLSYEQCPVAHVAFAEDMRLTFVNAYTYNHMEDNPVHIAAKYLLEKFEAEYERLVKTILQQREEEAAADRAASKKAVESGKRTKGRFTEAESDDEFAIKNFTYADSDSDGKSSKKSKGKQQTKNQNQKSADKGRASGRAHNKSNNIDEEDREFQSTASASASECDEENSSGSEDSDGFEYRVQHILAMKTMTPAEWRDVCEAMNTREITRGSAWKQPDEEYYDNSNYVVTKYLIKWMHASYLHVSWETEKDLLDCVGATAKTQLKKFHIRIALGQELFEDLGRGEFFLPAFTTVERVLDVDDPRVNALTVDWRHAPLPEFDPFAPVENSDDEGSDEEIQETKSKSRPSRNAHEDAMLQEPPADFICAEDLLPNSSVNMHGSESELQEPPADFMPADEQQFISHDLHADDELLELELSNSAPSAPQTGSNRKEPAIYSPNEALSVLTSPTKFDKSQLKEMLGMTTDAISPADLAAIAMDAEEELTTSPAKAHAVLEDVILFDSDEEREITERIRTQPKQSETKIKMQEADLSEGDEAETRRSSRTRKPVERLIADDDDQDEIPRRLRRIKEQGQQKPDAKARADKKAKAFKALLATESPCTDLHGSGKGTIWVTIKWEGLSYSDASFEDLRDLQRMYIDYEAPMRAYFKREQLTPTKGTTRVKRSLDAAVMEAPHGPKLPGTLELRDYQWEGVRWLLFNWSQRRNSILADEMGLGKTIQTAVFLQMLHKEQNMRGPFLIVAPLSTVTQWQREISVWTELDPIIYHGSVEDREVIRSYEFTYMSRKANEGTKLQVVITTPETCMSADSKTPTARVRRELTKIKWDLVVVDEAHKLKNYESKTGSILRDEFDYLNCLLLTGTPLQNNTDELWTLLNFVNREEFSDREAFCTEFGNLREAEQLQRLHERLKPYLLRREKEHVEKKVPPKEEVIVEVELTVPQKQYYRAIYEQKTGFLYKGGAKDGPSLSNLAMELRKCCNHPFLIKGAETELSKHFEGKTPIEQLVNSSGKMMLLDKLLPKLRDDGHRVLIFSQFRIMLNIIEDYMIMRGYSFERVDGAITGRKRQNAIDRYTNGGIDGKPEIFAMLLSTRAGGVGINLTAADTVIIFDSDWNPQNDIQAQARAHRIGQTKKVKVYRFITRKSYETAMFQAASIKLGLDYAVMGGMKPQLAGITGNTAENFSHLSKKELENLLKHGAYDIFNEEKDGSGAHASQQFAEDDIDTILQRSSVVVHGSKDSDEGETQDTKPSKSAVASFSKASFVSGTGSNDVAIDDPDFWSKVVGLSEGVTAEESSNRGRRCRDQVDSYKEPGMTFTVFETDSESGNESDSPQRRQKSDYDVPAEYTERNLSRLLQSLCDQGYGNWTAIRAATKLRWSHKDLAHASRAIMLQLLCWASLENEFSSKYWAGQTCPAGLKKSQWGFEDLQYIEEFLGRHRAIRLALAAMQEEQRNASAIAAKGIRKITTLDELYDACVANPLAVYFRKAVDPVALDIPDYFDIIKKPMDMGLIKQNLQRGHYDGDHAAFAVHMRLTFNNAYTYNHLADNPVHIAARAMEAYFEEKYAAYCAHLEQKPVEDELMAKAFEHTAQATDVQQDLFDFFDNAGVLLGAATLLFGDSEVTPTILSKADTASLTPEEQVRAKAIAEEENVSKQQTRHACIRAMVVSIRTLPALKFFDWWERDKTAALRTQARNKLRSIEDLFECRTLAIVAGGKHWAVRNAITSNNLFQESHPAEISSMHEVLPFATAEEAAALASREAQAKQVAEFVARAAIAARLSDCKYLDKPEIPGWDLLHDAWLVHAVSVVGWPEGKRKIAALQSMWEQFLAANPFAARAVQSLETQAVSEYRPDLTDTNACEEKNKSSDTTVLGPGGFPEDIVRSKFLAKRCKEIAAAMRGGSEAALAAAAKAEATAQRAAAAAEKAAAKAAKLATQLPKQLFAAMQRMGRVHEEYAALMALLPDPALGNSAEGEPEFMEVGADGQPVPTQQVLPVPGSADRRAYLLTWDSLAEEAGLSRDSDGNYDLGHLKAIAAAIVDAAFAPTDPTSAAQEIVTAGHPLAGSGLSPKVLLAGMDRIDHMHRLRLACACLDTEGLRAGILATCKQAGPDVGPARRDTTLPAWWTVEHDLRLLRLCCSPSYGYGQWKKLLADKRLADAPLNFEMPSKIQGFDWVTTLSPKVCEKRLQALSMGLARHMGSLPSGAAGFTSVPPGSPERRKTSTGPPAKKAKTAGNALVSTTPSTTAPLVTKLENYQKPAWINSFSSTKTTGTKPESAFAGAAKLRALTASSPVLPEPVADTPVSTVQSAGNGAHGMTVLPMVGMSPLPSPPRATSRRVSDIAERASQASLETKPKHDDIKTTAALSLKEENKGISQKAKMTPYKENELNRSAAVNVTPCGDDEQSESDVIEVFPEGKRKANEQGLEQNNEVAKKPRNDKVENKALHVVSEKKGSKDSKDTKKAAPPMGNIMSFFGSRVAAPTQ